MKSNKIKKQNIQKQKQKKSIRPNSKSQHKNHKNLQTLKYLNGFIDMSIPNFPKVKKISNKIPNSTRTIATPIISQNVSYSKLRSKSSYSQYKKKDSDRIMKDVLNINLENAITEDDLIKFTQISPINSQIQSILMQPIIIFKKSENMAATAIQRAWRKYQTLQMIKRYQIYFTQVQKKLELLEINKQKGQFDKTLKIKPKQNNTDQCAITQKNSAERQGLVQYKDISQTPSLSRIQNQSKNQSIQHAIQWMRQKQAQRWNQVMQIINRQKPIKPNKIILRELVQKLQQNKSDIQRQLQSLQSSCILQQNQMCSQHDKSPNYKIWQHSRNQQMSYKQLEQQFNDNQCKILQNRIQFIKEKIVQQTEKIENFINIGVISKKQGTRNIMILSSKYHRQIRYIEKILKQYKRCLQSINKIALKYQKQTYNSQKPQWKYQLRNAFSSGSLSLKCILENVKLEQVQVNIDSSHINVSRELSMISIVRSSSLESLKRQINASDQLNLQLMKCDSDQKSGCSQSIMKQYSQQMQQKIEQYLIWQFIQQVYTSQDLYRQFRPHIQKAFIFNKITDYQLHQFLQQLQNYFPSQEQLYNLLNQKINPTTSQILKIIRDYQYQLDQYQLILSDNVFKMYRQKLQEKYSIKKKQIQNKILPIDFSIPYPKIIQKLQQRREDKKIKYQKYTLFQRDLRIIYMKSVFNCLNQYLIQSKSFNSFMNGRSSIGPGELTMAIKQFNKPCSMEQVYQIISNCFKRILKRLKYKCIFPNFSNIHDIELFQMQALNQLKEELNQTQFKWVNFMDQVLELWYELSQIIIDHLFFQALTDLSQFLEI